MCKLYTPLPFHPWLEEMEKPRKALTSKVRGEPACPQQETEPSLHVSSWFWPHPCPVKQQDVIVDLVAAGGAIMGPLRRAGRCCYLL